MALSTLPRTAIAAELFDLTSNWRDTLALSFDLTPFTQSGGQLCLTQISRNVYRNDWRTPS